MNDETAKVLAEAMNRLAAAIEALPRDLMGIKVNHFGGPASIGPQHYELRVPFTVPPNSWQG